jgi:hypothetical protein
MTEIMSTMTVLVKSIKSTCRVKHLMEKDHPRGATLILLVSWGSRRSWVSELSEFHGCLDFLGVWISGFLGVWISLD